MSELSNSGLYEFELIEHFLRSSSDEQLAPSFLRRRDLKETTLLATEGFEERSIGLLRTIANARLSVGRVVLSRYSRQPDLNQRYRQEFEKLAARTGRKWDVVPNDNDGAWVQECLQGYSAGEVILDISGVSNAAVFACLDVLASRSGPSILAYSEAQEYWPRHKDWIQLKRSFRDPVRLAEAVDRTPWMFGQQHDVTLIRNHEGFDAAGAGRALVAFLPFKSARLGCLLSENDYASTVFIVGRPRLKKNHWRIEALKDINATLTRAGRFVELSTFGYRATVTALREILLGGDSPLTAFDTHLAPLGSKLQTVGCWVISVLMPSLTVLASTPTVYYPNAFSSGVGRTWLFSIPSIDERLAPTSVVSGLELVP